MNMLWVRIFAAMMGAGALLIALFMWVVQSNTLEAADGKERAASTFRSDCRRTIASAEEALKHRSKDNANHFMLLLSYSDPKCQDWDRAIANGPRALEYAVNDPCHLQEASFHLGKSYLQKYLHEAERVPAGTLASARQWLELLRSYSRAMQYLERSYELDRRDETVGVLLSNVRKMRSSGFIEGQMRLADLHPGETRRIVGEMIGIVNIGKNLSNQTSLRVKDPDLWFEYVWVYNKLKDRAGQVRDPMLRAERRRVPFE